MKQSPARAAIYARISDARDGDTTGVDRQVTDARELADRLGWTVVETFIDNDVSAYATKPRPAFERLLEAVAAGEIDALAVYDTTRLYRRLSDLERIVDALQGVAVETVRSGHVNLTSADGRLLARLLGSVSQHESEKRGERVARAAAERAKAGKFGGGKRRFGFSPDMSELVPAEADALAWAYEHIANGGTLEAAVREFTRRGLSGSLGARIDAVILRDYLLRATNAGHATHHGQIVGTRTGPAIVSPELHARVTAILTDPARRTTRGRPAVSLLAGVLTCPYCREQGERSRIGAAARRRAGKPTEQIYKCRRGCVSRTRGRLDAMVSALVVAYLVQHRDQLRRPSTPTGSNNAAHQADELRTRLDSLAELVATGALSPADYASAVREIRTRLEAVEATITRSTGRVAARSLVTGEDVQAAWDALDTPGRRAVIKELVGRVDMGRPPRPGPWDPAGITIEWRGQDAAVAA